MANAAFIGLGVMGFPMAGHLKSSGGHEVTVYNRTADTADRWCQQFGGTAEPTPAEAAAGQDFVFCCVGNDDDLREVTIGDHGAFAAMRRGAVFVDHTTASAEVARELHREAHQRGIGFIDAPVSGGEAGAQAGKLTVMAGGEEEHFAAARPLIDSYAKSCRLMGPPGCGQLTKMVNQIAITGIVQSLAEAIHFARRAGLDISGVVDAISKGAAQSWQMDNRAETMAAGEFDFGFAVDWMRKDFAICLDEARRNGARLPLVALIDQFYGEVQDMGGGRWDTSSLVALLERA